MDLYDRISEEKRLKELIKSIEESIAFDETILTQFDAGTHSYRYRLSGIMAKKSRLEDTKSRLKTITEDDIQQ